jgi:hypothetical protein
MAQEPDFCGAVVLGLSDLVIFARCRKKGFIEV